MALSASRHRSPTVYDGCPAGLRASPVRAVTRAAGQVAQLDLGGESHGALRESEVELLASVGICSICACFSAVDALRPAV